MERSSDPWSNFPGERLLQVPLPNHENERNMLSMKFYLVILFWWIIVPRFGVRAITRAYGNAQAQEMQNSPAKNKAVKPAHQVRKTRARQSRPSSGSSYRSLILFVVVGTLVSIGYVLMVESPNNALLARGVFEAPLLTSQECDDLLVRAFAAAQRNVDTATMALNNASDSVGYETTITKRKDYQQLVEEPHGWQKSRHSSYATTDLNLVTDPFTHEDRHWLAERLNRRLAPLLSRIYGIPIQSIRANDLFVVRYDVGIQDRLHAHTDANDISFNVLLNDDFEGGGTRFWKTRYSQVNQDDTSYGFVTVHPGRVGNVIVHPASIRHKGLPITEGTRFILVGFLSIDNIHPLTHRPTKLSWYASWLSVPWLSGRMLLGERIAKKKQRMTSSQRDAKGMEDESSTDPRSSSDRRSENGVSLRAYLYRLAHKSLTTLADTFGVHSFTLLVSNAHADTYLNALEYSSHVRQQLGGSSTQTTTKGSDSNPNAMWFSGQHLTLNVDGSMYQEWEERQQNADRYPDL